MRKERREICKREERRELATILENDFQNKKGENIFHLLKYVFSIDQKIDSVDFFIFHTTKRRKMYKILSKIYFLSKQTER